MLQPLTHDQIEALRKFEKTMTEKVIPEIVRVLEEREKHWQERYGRY